MAKPAVGSKITVQSVVDLIYPVGSIYMSTSSTNPNTLFGYGTWERIQDRFLLAAGSTYAAAGTGGAASVSYTPAGSNTAIALATSQIPSHNHTFTGTAVTSGGQSQTHRHTGTSDGQNQTHTHTGPSHSHQIARETRRAAGSSSGIPHQWDSRYDLYNSGPAGTGATGGASVGHTHTFTTGNASVDHTHSVTARGTIGNTGGGGTHNHTFTGTRATIATMPPYVTVYVWKRTA